MTSRLWGAVLLGSWIGGCSTGGGGGGSSTGGGSSAAGSGSGTTQSSSSGTGSGGSTSAGTSSSTGGSTTAATGIGTGSASTGAGATSGSTGGRGSTGSTSGGAGSSGGGGFAFGDGGVPPSPVQAGVSLPCTITIGTGSGALSYPTMQTTLGLVDGDVVCIAPGTYTDSTFAGITATTQPITLQNAPGGTVTFASASVGLAFSDLHDVVFSGAGDVGTPVGISVTSSFGDDIDISGPLDTFTVQNVDLGANVRYGIEVNDDSLVYAPGDPATTFHDLHFLNLTDYATTFTAINFGPASGLATATTFISLSQNVEIAHCDFGGISPGAVIDVDDVLAANVHDNRFLHVNKPLIDHDSVIFASGYGDFHDNYSEDYQGEGIRLWPFGVDGGTVSNIYDNINLGSLKYSAFEFQPHAPYLDVLKFLTPADEVATVNIYDNTAGDLDLGSLANPASCGDTNADGGFWYSALVDTYDDGTVNLENNLVFDTLCPNDSGAAQSQPASYGGHLVNYEGNIQPTFTTNLYFSSYLDAGLTSDLSVVPGPGSAAVGAGTAVSGLTTDFYGQPRGNPPSVGAVE